VAALAAGAQAASQSSERATVRQRADMRASADAHDRGTRGLAAWLDSSGEAPRWGLAETLVLSLWLLIAGFAVHQHVPWADEEQAWLLATGVSWKTLFVHSLHYEGTGGLWHAYLKILTDLGSSFTLARWITMLVEGAGMAVMLRWSPLPRPVRFLLPFSFFLLYQDGVVARS
jgi:hypothetical protein